MILILVLKLAHVMPVFDSRKGEFKKYIVAWRWSRIYADIWKNLHYFIYYTSCSIFLFKITGSIGTMVIKMQVCIWTERAHKDKMNGPHCSMFTFILFMNRYTVIQYLLSLCIILSLIQQVWLAHSIILLRPWSKLSLQAKKIQVIKMYGFGLGLNLRCQVLIPVWFWKVRFWWCFWFSMVLSWSWLEVPDLDYNTDYQTLLNVEVKLLNETSIQPIARFSITTTKNTALLSDPRTFNRYEFLNEKFKCYSKEVRVFY